MQFDVRSNLFAQDPNSNTEVIQAKIGALPFSQAARHDHSRLCCSGHLNLHPLNPRKADRGKLGKMF